MTGRVICRWAEPEHCWTQVSFNRYFSLIFRLKHLILIIFCWENKIVKVVRQWHFTRKKVTENKLIPWYQIMGSICKSVWKSGKWQILFHGTLSKSKTQIENENHCWNVLGSRSGSKTAQDAYTFQIILDKEQMGPLPTVQQLLESSFLSCDLKFEEVGLSPQDNPIQEVPL